jgi:hypothetical protein
MCRSATKRILFAGDYTVRPGRGTIPLSVLRNLRTLLFAYV